MSNIAIKGNASGTGTFTLEAPNSNTDRTLTLPDEAGTVLTSASSIPSSQITGSLGITVADQWYLTTTAQAPTGALTSNIDPVDQTGSGRLGSAMVKDANGVWTFPSTGIWQVRTVYNIANTSGATSDRAAIAIRISTDGGSTFTTASDVIASVDGAAEGRFDVGVADILVDVTSTSNVKVRFDATSFASGTFLEGRSDLRTYFTFIRLGDT